MINQPQEDIKIPENLAKAIEKSRNLVTINEAEAFRLQGLVNSLEYTIREKHKQDIDFTEKLSVLESKISNLESEIILNEAIIESKKLEIDDIQVNYNVIQKTIEEDQEKLKVEIFEFNKKKEWIDKKVIELEEIEKDIKSREEIIKTKEDKLKEYFK